MWCKLKFGNDFTITNGYELKPRKVKLRINYVLEICTKPHICRLNRNENKLSVISHYLYMFFHPLTVRYYRSMNIVSLSPVTVSNVIRLRRK